MDTQWVLDQAVDLFKEELGGNLVGIYLHGSLAMGCFNPDTSDIDLLLVVEDKLTRDHMRRLAKKIIAFHDGMPNQQGLELSLVLESSLQETVYPPPFEFHYSAFHREKYLNDDDYLCGGFQDADLAAHYTVILHLRTLPSKYHPIIKRALHQYSELAQNSADSAPDELIAFAGDMLEQIRKELE
ncbi:nucleotidyltransferase domain-containing protein [Paenibacillus lautus]|uniref:nucleotidyltransferase domain-containing protein n=1 Tax=Paenibacillus lautus TaxID=1401 RepID=UPI003D2DC937